MASNEGYPEKLKADPRSTADGAGTRLNQDDLAALLASSNCFMRQAVIDARVSSKDQEREGFSIPALLRLLQEYAAQHGFQILREFIDVENR